MSSKFEVVISGVSGRFPQCDDIATFRRKLYQRENFITFSDEKWPAHYKYKFDKTIIPHGSGKYTDIDQYDAMVFKLNHVFAKSNDILNRKALEPSCEAIMDAGINPYSLDGQNIGVFMSCGFNEMDSKGLDSGHTHDRNLLMMIGCSKTMLSNRISFAFNFKGPSFTYYTDILGGMEALLAGYRNVADGFVDAAVVGMTSNLIDPVISLHFLSLDLLSPDAMCRSFDESANGFGRSESTVIFYLQRAEDAKRNYGTIRLCDAYYLGLNPSSLIGFDENYLLHSLQNIYKNSDNKIDPEEVSFVEMNASGVPRLEEIESKAVAEIFCKNRKDPLLVGSVKSNVGHTEGASPIMSVLKALFTLDTNQIAPNLHYKKANNKAEALRDGKLKVVEEVMKLPGNTVGVNSLGLVGSVGHIVIQQNSKEKSENTESNLPRLLVICGRTEEGVRAAIAKIEALPFDADFISLTNQVFGSHMPLHVYRGYTILPKFFGRRSLVGSRGEQNRPVWFLFSGLGSQWNGMGRGLLNIPVFADVIRRCDAILRPRGLDIYKILTSEDASIFDNIVNAFVGIITVQIGLVEILKLLKIEADGIIGHSVGENGCAYADGCLTLEQAVLASWARGVASVEIETVKGMMAAIGKGYDEMKNSLPEDIQVACHNSSTSCTLTGPAEKVHEFVAKLQNDGVFAKAVNVANIAYHSKFIAPAGPGLQQRLKEVITQPKTRSAKWISTSVPESAWDTPLAKSCSAEYLTNNLLNAVLFEEGCRHIPSNAIVIEIAPHGLLQAILKRSLPDGCSNIPLTLKSHGFDNVNTLLSGIGKLYVAGCEPDVNALYPEISYPVPRGTLPISPFGIWDHSALNVKMAAMKPRGFCLSGEPIHIQVNENSQYHYLRHHRIGEQIYIPSAFFMYLTWSLSSRVKNTVMKTSSVLFENVRIRRNITISVTEPKTILLTIQVSGYFEITLVNANESDDLVVMSGKIELPAENFKIDQDEDVSVSTNFVIGAGEFYGLLKQAGYVLDDCFVAVKERWKCESDYFGRITWNGNWVAFLDSLMKFQMFSEMTASDLLCPTFVRRLYIRGPEFESIQSGSAILCHEDPRTKRVVCNGLEMNGLEYELMPISSQDSSKIRLAGLRFTPLSDSGCKSECQFVKLCLLLASEYLSMAKNCAGKLSVVNEVKNLEKPIEKMIHDDSTLKSNVSLHELKEEFHRGSSGQRECFLLVTENLGKASTVEWDTMFVLLIVSKNGGFKINPTFVEILKKTFDGKTYNFLKTKSTDNGYNKIPDVVRYEDWILNPEVKRPMVVVKEHMNAVDLSSMLSRRKEYNDTRFLYRLDDSKLTEYDELLKSNILHIVPTAVMKNGVWGTYRKQSGSDTIRLDERESPKRVPQVNIQLASVQVHYFNLCGGINVGSSSHNSTSCIGYSGVNSSGHRVMGFSYIDAFEEVQANPNLVWCIPNSWSLEDAATLLLPYAQAYHILRVVLNGDRLKSILINVENEYLLAQACVALALQSRISVYLSIADSAGKQIIRSKFPALEAFRILDSENIEKQLLSATGNERINAVVNCAPGNASIIESLNCIAEFGYYVEVGLHNCHYTKELGLHSFLKSISFFTVPHGITALLNLSEEDQRKLKDLMNDGIKNGIVKPFKKAHSNVNFTERLQSTNLANPSPKVNQEFQIDANHSYLIIGGDHNHSWLKLIKWLADKGARKFVVAIDSLKLGLTAVHSVNYLVDQKRVNITLSSSRRVESAMGAAQLINDAEKIAPLEAIFFVALTHGNASKKIHNMDVAARLQHPYVKFVSIFSGGLKECESRRALGFPALVIHGENRRKLTRILPLLEVRLSQPDDHDSPTLYTVISQSDVNEKQLKRPSLADYLLKNHSLLEEIGGTIVAHNRFVEVPSASRRYSETKGVFPIFVVPAINASRLEPLTRKLGYPVFCATCAHSAGSSQDIASDLFEALNEIQPEGPVTVVGETWSSNIALEIASLVKHSERACRVFLIEGNPLMWHKILKTLDPVSAVQFDSNVARLFDNAKMKETVDMPTRLCQAQIRIVNEENVKKAISLIRNRLLMMARYKLRDEILSDVFLLQRHQSDISSLRLSTTSKLVCLEDTSYDNLLANAKLTSVINENAAFSWWDYSRV